MTDYNLFEKVIDKVFAKNKMETALARTTGSILAGIGINGALLHLSEEGLTKSSCVLSGLLIAGGYLSGYAGANLFMTMFPQTKKYKSSYLVAEEPSAQCALVLATAVSSLSLAGYAAHLLDYEERFKEIETTSISKLEV